MAALALYSGAMGNWVPLETSATITSSSPRMTSFLEISALIQAPLSVRSQPSAGIQVSSVSKPSTCAWEKLTMPSEKISGSLTWICISSHSMRYSTELKLKRLSSQVLLKPTS